MSTATVALDRFLVVVLGNVTDFDANRQFVHHALATDIFLDGRLM